MELLTVSNAAARLRCSEGTIRRWADSGRLRVWVRLADGTRLFRERDVRALLKRQSAEPLLTTKVRQNGGEAVDRLVVLDGREE